MRDTLKILFLAHRLPYPPNKGDKIRSFHELEHLSRRHRVWCATFVDDPADLPHVTRLEDYCQAVAAVPLSRTRATARGFWHQLRGGTATEGFYADRRMGALLRGWARTVCFDAVVVFSSGMAPYGLECPARRRVLDFCDWDSAKWAEYARRGGLRGRLFGVEARRLAQREVHWARRYDACTIITQQEAADRQHAALDEHPVVVRNGVGLRPLAPLPAEPRVGFVGAMDYPPNVDAVCWFAEEIWPGVRARCPEARFQIVGRRPGRRVRRLAEHPGIEVVGEVSAVGAYLDGFAVAIAPLRIARGLQNKALEAMAAGRPLVLTPAAARGIGAEHGRQYLIAEDPVRFAAQVTALLADRRRAAALGEAARAFVADHFDWRREMAKLEALLAQPPAAVAPPAAPAPVAC